MQAQIAQIQESLKRRLSREIVTKQLQPFFSCLLSTPVDTSCEYEESLHLLLTSLLKMRGLSSSMDSPLNIYLASIVLSLKQKAVKDSL